MSPFDTGQQQVRYVGESPRRNGRILEAGSVGSVVEDVGDYGRVQFTLPLGIARLDPALLDRVC